MAEVLADSQVTLKTLQAAKFDYEVASGCNRKLEQLSEHHNITGCHYEISGNKLTDKSVREANERV